MTDRQTDRQTDTDSKAVYSTVQYSTVKYKQDSTSRFAGDKFSDAIVVDQQSVLQRLKKYTEDEID